MNSKDKKKKIVVAILNNKDCGCDCKSDDCCAKKTCECCSEKCCCE